MTRQHFLSGGLNHALTERALRLTLDNLHSSGFSYYRRHQQCSRYLKNIIMHLVEQRFNLFLPFPLADLVGIRNLEELWCHLHQPFRLDGRDVMTILPSCQNQLIVNQPLRISVEQRRGRVDIHRCPLSKRFISLLWIFLGRIPEEARAYRFTDPVIVSASGYDIMFVPESSVNRRIRIEKAPYRSMMPTSCLRIS